MLTVIKVRFICYLLWLWTWRSLYEMAADTWGTRRLWRDELAIQCSGCTWRDWCRAGLWQTRTCTGPPQSWRTPSAIGSELQKQTFESLRANYSFRKGFIFSLKSRTLEIKPLQNNYKIGITALRLGKNWKDLIVFFLETFDPKTRWNVYTKIFRIDVNDNFIFFNSSGFTITIFFNSGHCC